MIDGKYYEKCLLCKEIFKDNITHWATECEGTLKLRDKWLKEIKMELQKMHKENWKIPMVCCLLNGENTNCDKKIVKSHKTKCTNFMRGLAKLRKEEIKKLLIEKKMNTQNENEESSPKNVNNIGENN